MSELVNAERVHQENLAFLKKANSLLVETQEGAGSKFEEDTVNEGVVGDRSVVNVTRGSFNRIAAANTRRMSTTMDLLTLSKQTEKITSNPTKKSSSEIDGIFEHKTVVDKNEIYAIQKDRLKAINFALEYRKRMLEVEEELKSYKAKVTCEVERVLGGSVRGILEKLRDCETQNDSLRSGIRLMREKERAVNEEFQLLKTRTEEELQSAQHDIVEAKNKSLNALVTDIEERGNYTSDLERRVEETEAKMAKEIAAREERIAELERLVEGVGNRARQEMSVDRFNRFEKLLRGPGIVLNKHASSKKKRSGLKLFTLSKNMLLWSDEKEGAKRTFDLSSPARVERSGDRVVEIVNPVRNLILEVSDRNAADEYAGYFERIMGGM